MWLQHHLKVVKDVYNEILKNLSAQKGNKMLTNKQVDVTLSMPVLTLVIN